MDKVTRTRVNVKYQSAADWPSTEEIDGCTYGLGPEPSDSEWASESFNQGDDGHTSDYPPDDVLDQMADEAHAAEMMERGLRLF